MIDTNSYVRPLSSRFCPMVESIVVSVRAEGTTVIRAIGSDVTHLIPSRHLLELPGTYFVEVVAEPM